MTTRTNGNVHADTCTHSFGGREKALQDKAASEASSLADKAKKEFEIVEDKAKAAYNKVTSS